MPSKPFRPDILMQNADYLTIPMALKWLEEHYNYKTTRMSLYNWIHVGRLNRYGRRWRLLHTTLCGQIVVTKPSIISFMESMI